MSVFADKTTIILRKMLKNPEIGWVIHNFIKTKDKIFGLGQGRVQKVLNEMEHLGYVEREKRGAKSKTILTNPKQLIDDWTKAYKFGFNEIYSYYSHDKSILKKIKEYLNKHYKNKYAFTLHTAANLFTFFVKTEDIYFYFQSDNLKEDILNIRQDLDLKQLVQGGNIHIVKPYYKNSVFFNVHEAKGYRVVSNLQLYLDLYNFQPRGREHAEHIKDLLEHKGKQLV